ncbi:hypothetical protein F4801DRAFT_544083 [Xylaria longipes]|nr:hypothetical protein F4801DRAFT_544083 [Xylaria longipes]
MTLVGISLVLGSWHAFINEPLTPAQTSSSSSSILELDKRNTLGQLPDLANTRYRRIAVGRVDGSAPVSVPTEDWKMAAAMTYSAIRNTTPLSAIDQHGEHWNRNGYSSSPKGLDNSGGTKRIILSRHRPQIDYLGETHRRPWGGSRSRIICSRFLSAYFGHKSHVIDAK